jgi:hypothetical protein
MSRFAIELLEGRTLFASYTAATSAQLIGSINAANQSPEADTITLAAATTFSLTSVHNGESGLPIIAGGGGNLTILGNGDTIERSAVPGTPAFRLFDVAAGASLTLKNLTLQGGLAGGEGYVVSEPKPGFPTGFPTGMAPTQGGGIRNYGALSLDGVTIQNNTAQGATGFEFLTNPLGSGSGMGGGIYSAGSLLLSGCTIRNNAAIGGAGLRGNGSNQNGYSGFPGADGCGGGIYIAAGTASINGSNLSANVAIGGTGGAGGTLAGQTPVRYAGSGGNGLGGGLFAAGGSIELRNSTVTLNLAQGGAAGEGIRTNKIGVPGTGIGGGLYFGASASAGLDRFTKNHVTQNTASKKSDFDIFGQYHTIA